MTQAHEAIEPTGTDQEQSMIPVSNLQDHLLTVCSEAGRINRAMKLVDVLIEEHSHLEAYVILKNAEGVIKHAIEIEQSPATLAMTEKEQVVMGAKVTSKRIVKYEDIHPSLARIDAEIKILKEKKKAIEEMHRVSEMIDELTGEMVPKAKKVADGQTVAVTLPK
jgi:hypothetical protein